MPAYSKAFKKFKLQNHSEFGTAYIYQKVKKKKRPKMLVYESKKC